MSQLASLGRQGSAHVPLSSEDRPAEGAKCACAGGPRPAPRGGEMRVCCGSETRPQEVGCACATGRRRAPKEAGREPKNRGVALSVRPSGPWSVVESTPTKTPPLALGPMPSVSFSVPHFWNAWGSNRAPRGAESALSPGPEEIGEAHWLAGAEGAGSFVLRVEHVGCCSSEGGGRLLETKV